MNKTENSIVHSTPEGKLYIKEEEFFNTNRFKYILEKLLNSSVYKKIKSKEAGVNSK